MIEPEFIDDGNIPLLERDDSVYDRLAAQQEQDSQTETSFNHDDVI